MEEVKNNSSRFIGETTKYQIDKFNKGLTEKIKLKTGQRMAPSANDMVFVKNTKRMKTDTYVCTSSQLVRTLMCLYKPEECNHGKINRVQRHRRS